MKYGCIVYVKYVQTPLVIISVQNGHAVSLSVEVTRCLCISWQPSIQFPKTKRRGKVRPAHSSAAMDASVASEVFLGWNMFQTPWY